jgi:hypothetical protein
MDLSDPKEEVAKSHARLRGELMGKKYASTKLIDAERVFCEARDEANRCYPYDYIFWNAFYGRLETIR